MDLAAGTFATVVTVSGLTLVGCYLAALATSTIWSKLRPAAKKRPRAWVLALVLWGWLGGGVLFLLDSPEPPSATGAAPPPQLSDTEAGTPRP